MIDRRLILSLEGAPLCWGITAGDIRKRILDYPDDDADLFQVWYVPSAESMAAAEDITQRFALDWSKDFDFGGGIEPVEYLAPFPAFVREAAGKKLIEKWNDSLTQRDTERKAG